jgi:hypothetical protein
VQEEVNGPENRSALATRRLLARCLVSNGQAERALELCAELGLIEQASDRVFTRLIEAKAYAAKGDTQIALEWVDGVIADLQTRFAPTHIRLVEAQSLLARLIGQ